MKFRMEKQLPDMECQLPVYLEGGPFDGAVLFVATDKAPVTIQFDEFVYRVDVEVFDSMCSDVTAVFVQPKAVT